MKENENLRKIGNVNPRLLNIKAGLVDFTGAVGYHQPIEKTEEPA